MEQRPRGWLTQPGPVVTDDGFACWPIHDVLTEGGLWFVNRTAFHPAGWRLIYHHDTDGMPIGFVAEYIGMPIEYPPEADAEMGPRFARMIGTPTEGDT